MLDEENYGLSRERITPPREAHEYLPELMAKSPLHTSLSPNSNSPSSAAKTRNAIKPLHIIQPEGVSFSLNGNELEWQKWKMHVSFNGREGLVLSTVSYEDELEGGSRRGVMYRMSLAEMVVPYGAPEHPHGRKFAFDV